MKKALIFLVLMSIFTSCYDDYRLDNDTTTVAFANVTGGSNQKGVLWRTIVKDEGLSLDAGIYLAGVLENKKERSADYIIDPSLLNGTTYTLLPEDYYTLSDPKQFVIKPGEYVGKVKITLDSIKFLNDPMATKAHYALPIRLIKTSEDSILTSQSTQILVIKYMNRQEGFYENKGNFVTYSGVGATLNTGSIDNVLMSSTVSPYVVETNGSMHLVGPDYKMKLNVNSDNTVSLSYSPNLNPSNGPVNIALDATPVAPSVSPWENVKGVNDGYTPSSSMDKNGIAYGNWPNAEKWNYVEYQFKGAYAINKSDVYWWTDNGGILIPYNTYLQYWDLDTQQWKLLSDNITVNGVPIPSNQYGSTTGINGNNPGPGTKENQFNVTTFASVATTKVRVYFIAVESQGILEWRVWGVPAYVTLESHPIESITANGANTYDPATSTFTLNYKVKYIDKDYYTNVSATMKWRNRIRDGVNEWRR